MTKTTTTVDPCELRAWMESLTWQELQSASQFLESQEVFLQEMVLGSVALGTPIHPKACPIFASQSTTATDGRFATEFERLSHDRRNKPRLLRWTPKQTLTSSSSSAFDRGGGKKRPQGSLEQQYHVLARGFLQRDGSRLAVPPLLEQQKADEALLQHLCVCTPLQHDSSGICATGRYLRLLDHDKKLTAGELWRLLRIASRGNFLSKQQQNEKTEEEEEEEESSVPKRQQKPSKRQQQQSSQASSSSPLIPAWFSPTERWFPLAMYMAARMEVALAQSFLQYRQQHQQENSSMNVPRSFPSFLPKLTREALLQMVHQDKSSHLPHVRDCWMHSILSELPPHSTIMSSAVSNPTVASISLSSTVSLHSWVLVCPLVQMGSGLEQFYARLKELWLAHAARQAELELLHICEDEGGSQNHLKKKKKKKNNGTRRGNNKKKTNKMQPTHSQNHAFLRGGNQPHHPPLKHRNNGHNHRSRGPASASTRFREPSSKKKTAAQKTLHPPPPPRLSRLEEDDNEDKEEEDEEALPSSSDEEKTQSTDPTRSQASLDFPEKPDNISSRARNRNIVLVLGLLDDVVEATFSTVGLVEPSVEEVEPVEQQQVPKEEKAIETTSTKEYAAQDAATTEQTNDKVPSVPLASGSIRQPQPFAAADTTPMPVVPSDESIHYPVEPAADEYWMNPSAPAAAAAPGSFPPLMQDVGDVPPDDTTTIPPSRGAFDIFASPYGNLAGGFLLRPESIDFAWDTTHDFAFHQPASFREQSIMHDLFLSQERREQEMASSTIASIASSGPYDDGAEDEEEDPDLYILDVADDENEDDNKNVVVIAEEEREDDGIIGASLPQQPPLTPKARFMGVDMAAGTQGGSEEKSLLSSPSSSIPSTVSPAKLESASDEALEQEHGPTTPIVNNQYERKEPPTTTRSRSQSPQAPTTPSPTLSPILVSLADLQVMRRTDSTDNQTTSSDVRSSSSVPAGSAASTRNPPRVVSSSTSPRPRMVTSLSRENLRSSFVADEGSQRRSASNVLLGTDEGSQRRSASNVLLGAQQSPATTTASTTAAKPNAIKLQRSSSAVKYASPTKAHDDAEIKSKGSSLRRRPDALETYRAVVSRSLAKSRDDYDVVRSFGTTPTRSSYHRPRSMVAAGAVTPVEPPEIAYAHSETGDDPMQAWHDSRRSSALGDEADNNTATKDGSTTISSALSPREPAEENLQEERDTYRDLCLTLGAEVAKLKNILASQMQNLLVAPAFDYAAQQQQHHLMNPSQLVYGPDYPASLTHLMMNPAARSQTLAAMSDAGYRVEHESMASEDDFGGGTSTGPAKIPQHHRQVSSGATAASDTSIEHHSVHHHHHHLNVTVGIPSHPQNNQNSIPSRLSLDMLHFVDVIGGQLRKQELRRAKAVERMTRLVTTLWPRAQVKLYGSHVTGLCLPTSDVDFVICLPAVQKDTPAVAPGVLEGRNAINESSQKMLARKLKNESWIEQRSLKLIERTVVPVIKVSTKDTKAKTLHLDITFDAPSHHGLEAVELVDHLLEELPMIRSLVLVLKQFLLDRGLLTAYTGGLSSYCLFLMTARYLREQAASWADCGALLMGFLDFYGNHFDPRTTGISIHQYFARPNYASVPPHPPQQMIWNANMYNETKSPELGNGSRERSNYVRRNSFSDKGNVDGLRGATTGANRDASGGGNHSGLSPVPHPPPPQQQQQQPQPQMEGAPDHGMPYAYDPLFVEDPLAMGNNVGRNTFRIFQCLRAFSDAHRALVASLEWDMQSSGVDEELSEYPLLKCLLHSEDVVFDL